MKLRISRPKYLVSLSILLVAMPLTACRIQQEETGSLPDVDVQVEPGSLPEYDIQGPDVNIGVTERTVTVPRVVVVQEEQTIEVPYIDVDVPGAERVERTITPEVEVPSGGYNLAIQGVHVVDNELWVVSLLEEVDPNALAEAERVSDRVVLNAPDMPIRHFIVGERPEGSFNEQYTFIDNRDEIAPELSAGRQIYDRTT
ncbi:hypothetical protein [Phormidium tenue]|uniref:G5 domain-containing protein n=2 Tax=Phormidium tenue TaxID=126344 RepID=A0A1U7J831_9CYAN|nr:hypothetical protein [Phormidium tenue]MBD2231216.1 hypothetical protein [Phormidium tenue FACHB-1052]OKH49466.1 hypothetical protein NIES30_06360 [Phormidium tenue NIES-30]